MNEELLICLVQKYTELYNHEDPHYHDDQRRMNIWEEIAGTMNETREFFIIFNFFCDILKFILLKIKIETIVKLPSNV